MSFDRSHQGSRGKLQLDSALTTRWSGCVGVLVLGAIMWGQVLLGARWAEAERTWKSVQELSAEELHEVDLRTETPRDPNFPYLLAERYPFSPPYTAEEMGYRAMEFSHFARWSHALGTAAGSITPSGHLFTENNLDSFCYLPPEGLSGQLYDTAPGTPYLKLLSQGVFPPERYGTQSLFVLYRTDTAFVDETDFFVYTPSLRRVRHQPPIRREDHYPRTAMRFDDVLVRNTWEYSWRLLGTEVLDRTVRFPVTRKTITLADPDGAFQERAVNEINKMMGESYPAYTPDGGVACYVVEARPRPEWRPTSHLAKLIYWLDRHAFFPLRIESYDREGNLARIEVRTARLLNPRLGERGYASHFFLFWDVARDYLSYDIHDTYQERSWSEQEKTAFFSPDFMRREWFLGPPRSQAGVPSAAEFYLRPALDPGKFPHERTIRLPAEVAARVEAQESAGYLVF